MEQTFDRGFFVPRNFAEACRRATVPPSPTVPATRQYDVLKM